MSDEVTWQICPHCGNRAALHWTEGQLVQWECLYGCALTADELRRLLATTQLMPLASGSTWTDWERDPEQP